MSTRSFETHQWERHGLLRVSKNGHYLEFEDGTGFVWLGDTAWRLVRLKPEDLDRYFTNRVERGFNVVLFTAANMNGLPNFAGETPFTEDRRQIVKPQLNEPYWKHVDLIVRRAREVGIFLGILPWWGVYVSNPLEPEREAFADPDIEILGIGREMGSRYGSEPHVMWIVAGEYHKPFFFPPFDELHLRRLSLFAKGVKETFNGKQLITIHPLSRYSSSEDFHNADWLDFNMIQTHTSADTIQPLTIVDWARDPAKPTVNAEGWYEDEEMLFEQQTGFRAGFRRGRFHDPYDAAWIQRYQMYWSLFFGGIGYTYGHGKLWRMSDSQVKTDPQEVNRPGTLLQSALNAPGSESLRYARLLMESRTGQNRVPDQTLLVEDAIGTDSEVRPNLRCATRSQDSTWAMVYSTAGKVIGVKMERLAKGRACASWYNPRTGLWRANGNETEEIVPFETGIASGPGSDKRYFLPPVDPPQIDDAAFNNIGQGEDWVLLLEVS